MKITIAATDNSLKAPIATHFGKSQWFCVYDTESGIHEFIENRSLGAQGTPGCHAAQMVIDRGSQIVVAGRFGSKAIGLFRDKQIQLIVPDTIQTIQEIISLLK